MTLLPLLFIHDHQFFFREEFNEYYSNGGLPYSAWTRYLSKFKSITVLAALSPTVSFTNQLTLSSGSRVTFNLLTKWKIATIIKNILTIYSSLKKHRYILLRLPSKNGFIAAFICLFILNKKYSVEVVDCVFDYYRAKGLFSRLVTAFFARAIARLCIKKAKNALYVTSHFLQKQYPPNPHAYVMSASNVELPDFVNFPDTQNTPSKRRVFTIGSVGSIKGKSKGFDVIIKAISELKKQGIVVLYQIVGYGSPNDLHRLAVKYYVEDQIVFLGGISSRRDLFNWLGSIDLYAHPSRKEGLPRALLEACSAGLPCIGSEAGAIPEILPSECIFEINNHIQASLLIKLFYQNPPYRACYSQRNHAVSFQYSAEILETKRSLFYDQIILSST